MKKGFTLIELLIVVAIIGIIVVAVIVALNPTARVQDAQSAALKAQVSSIGTAYDTCLSYVDTTASPAVQNTATDCGLGQTDWLQRLAGTATTNPAGKPYLKSVPTNATFTITAAGTVNVNGCINGTIAGTNIWAQFRSSDNSLVSGTTGTLPACP